MLKNKRILFAIAWYTFTVALGIWWFVLGLRLVDELSRTNTSEDLGRLSRMIVWEGVVFIALLTTGGFTLIWLSYRDLKRHQLIHDFFSTVTHEMRTPLASLQLQLDALMEDFEGQPVAERMRKLALENRRIESRMNKSFYLASLMRGEGLFIERVQLVEVLDRLLPDWPELIVSESEPVPALRADRRALESVVRNLIENSVRHGGANRVELTADVDEKGARITIRDNGKGFHGSFSDLGRMFVRHSSTSGTGIGIYIVKRLVTAMRGTIEFRNRNDQGFEVILGIPLWVEK